MSNLELKKIDKNLVYSKASLLGKGAFGEVYLGFEMQVKQPVAVKVITLQKVNQSIQQQTILQKLKDEIVNMQIAKDEHVVEFLQAKHSQKHIYIVCEYCNGINLDKFIRSKNYLPEAEALSYFTEILQGFKHLNQKKIVHRDLKPANLLMHHYCIKIADLGFSKATEGHDQLLESTVGSPYYMSPQIFNRQKYTAKTDIWSLGVILYQMLYGRVPWVAQNILELKEKVQSQCITFPKIPFVTMPTRELIFNMLQREEDNRIDWSYLLGDYLEKDIQDQRNGQFRNNNISIMEDEELENKLLNQWFISPATCHYFQSTFYLQSYLQFPKVLKQLKIQYSLEQQLSCLNAKSVEDFFQRQRILRTNSQLIDQYYNYFICRRNEITYLLRTLTRMNQLITSQQQLCRSYQQQLIILAHNCTFLVCKLAIASIDEMLDNNYLKVQGELNKFELVTKICLPYDSLIVLLLRNDRMILEQEHSLVMDYFAKFKSLLKQEEAAAIDHKFSGLYNCISGDIRLIKFLLYNEFRNIFNLLKASILSEPTCMTDELNQRRYDQRVLLSQMINQYLSNQKLFILPKELGKDEKNLLQLIAAWETEPQNQYLQQLCQMPVLKTESISEFIGKEFKRNHFNFSMVMLE